MRKFAGNYISGRVKVKHPSEVTDDRHTYLGLDQAEPNLGTVPDIFKKTIVSVDENTNTIEITAHGYAAGDKVIYGYDDGVTPIGNLTQSVSYYVIDTTNPNTIRLATSKANAQGGTAHPLTSSGGTGNHYIGKTTFFTNTLNGERMQVSIGDDLFLDQTGSGFEMKLSPGATQDIITNTVSATTLENITGVGASTPDAISITNNTATGTAGSGALTVTGGASFGKGVLVPEGEYVRWAGSGASDGQQNIDIVGDLALPHQTSTLKFKVGGYSSEFTLFGNEPIGDPPGSSNVIGTISTISLNPGSGGANTDSISRILGSPTIVIDPHPHDAVGGNVIIKGNLDVQGTQTTINSTSLEIADANIIVAKNAYTSNTTSGAGFQFGNYDDPTNFSGTGGQWIPTGTNFAVNLVPQITWDNSTSKIVANKPFEATSFSITGGSNNDLIAADGSTITNDFVSTNTTYALDAVTDGSNGVIQLTGTDTTSDQIIFKGNTGITVTSTARVTGQSPAPAIVEINGTGLFGTTYGAATAPNAIESSHLDLKFTALTGNTAANTSVQFRTNGNLSVGNASNTGYIVIEDSADPSYTTLSVINGDSSTSTDMLDDSEVASTFAGNTHGVVGKFDRPLVQSGNYGGVILSQINDNAGNHSSYMSFSNIGTSVANTDQPVQGEISIKKAEVNNFSGIRIWGQENIDFDVDSGPQTPNSTGSRRASITSAGLSLRNNGKLRFDDISGYTANLSTTVLTNTRNYVLPDDSGTIALLSDIGTVGNLTTELANTSVNSDKFMVFATTGVSPAGTAQAPLTATGLLFNANTGLMKVPALEVATQLSTGGNVTVTGSLTATSKSFLIDHPTKNNMKLQYTCLEGPENGVYVRGRLKDCNVIELPDYWVGLVDETTITVNLTPIGHSQDLYVQDIINNQIIISDNKNINCFYTIFAERKDIDKLVVEYEDV